MDSDVASTLPPEILEKIFSLLQLKELIACSKVSVGWYQVANSVRFWKKFVCFQNGGVLDCELRKCDAVTSNFPKKSLHGLKTITMPSTSSPLNNIKIFLKQRNFLKHNWVRGIFVFHCLQPKVCRFKKSRVYEIQVSYPSKAPQDCLYYPILGTRKFGRVGFYLIRLDDEPRIVYRLIRNVNLDSDRRFYNGARLYVACVMRDYVVWVTDSTVQCLALTCELKNSKVQTLSPSLNWDEYEINITMDSDHILASCLKFCYVWCKKTLKLKFSVPVSKGTMVHRFCLNDGYLIISILLECDRVSTIEIYNLRNNNVENMLQSKFYLDGVCIGLKCSTTSIVIQYRGPGPKSDDCYAYDNFQVRDKSNSTIKFLYTSTYGSDCIFEVINDLLLFYSPDLKIWTVRNLSTGDCNQRELSANVCQGQLLFDNILVQDNNGSFEVWDWVRNVRLYSLLTKSAISTGQPQNGILSRLMRKVNIPGLPRGVPLVGGSIIHVSETRIITLDSDGNFKVYGFG